jgi:glycosyltransferase involved in cell wall biosynthesis
MTTGLRALYLCYFGIREPLVQTQVLPYLRELAAGGVAMSLLTFEPAINDASAWRERLRADGIDWHMLPYHKRAWLKPYDIVRGAWRAASIARRGNITLFHGRSHVGTAIGALAKWLTGGRLIFDVRGFLAEEYVDSGNWRADGLLYRATKAAERRLYRAADGFVVLTERAREAIPSNGRPLEVIPCCVDPERFASGDHADLGVTKRPIFVYAGALGGYYLVDEMVALLAKARAFALVLTQGSTAPVIEALQRAGFTSDDYRVLQVAPAEVPKYLRAADVALLLVRRSYARSAMSPTKFAEYLAAGLPVIASAGIGDLDTEIPQQRVGVLLQGNDYDGALRAIDDLRRDPDLAARCRAVARTRYDLHTIGGARYRRLYDAVSSR